MPCGTFSDIVFASTRLLGNIGAPLKGPNDNDNGPERVESEPIISGDKGGSPNMDDPRLDDAIHV